MTYIKSIRADTPHDSLMPTNSLWLILALLATPIEDFLSMIVATFQIAALKDLLPYVDVGILTIVWFHILFSEILNQRHGGLVISTGLLNTTLLILIYVLLYMISETITPSIITAMTHPYIEFIFKCAPLFYYGVNIVDWNRLIYKLKPVVAFSMLFGVFGVWYCSHYVYGGLAMGCAYDILVGGMIAFALFMDSHKLRYLVFFGCVSIILLLLGSRGAFVSIIIMVLCTFLYLLDKRKKGHVVIFLLFICGALCCILLYEPILNALTSCFPKTRILQSLKAGNLLEDSSRSNLATYGLDVLKANPLKFQGIFADRVILINHFGGTRLAGFWIDETAGSNLYVHNIFLEILIQFGCLIGFFVLLLVLRQIWRVFNYGILKATDRATALWCIILLSAGFIPLFVSSSYIINPMFWMLMGTGIASLRQKKRMLHKKEGIDIDKIKRTSL